MKFKAIGSNRDTGARMVLEFEAESKAAAERKATQSGMNVNSVQDISDGDVEHAGIVGGGASKRKERGANRFRRATGTPAQLARACLDLTVG